MRQRKRRLSVPGLIRLRRKARQSWALVRMMSATERLGLYGLELVELARAFGTSSRFTVEARLAAARLAALNRSRLAE